MSSPPLVCVADFEEEAKHILSKRTADYICSGAGEEITLRLNRQAFQRIRIVPKYFRNVLPTVDTACSILGHDLKWPLGIAPSAFQKASHEDAEAGNARAAGAVGSIFILSHYSSMSTEEVAMAAPDTIKWQQIYLKDRAATEERVRRAENCNFKAIVITVDNVIVGQRWADDQHRLASIRQSTEEKLCSWHDLEWLVKLTHLPVIAKGILTVEGALLAQKAGCAGVIVSNHGARHLDCQESSIQALPHIVKAVGNHMVVMLDSGIRTGNDIFKALALGAKMVFIGRPAVWGLACGGESGVKDLLDLLRTDFVKVMTLAGCTNLNAIEKDMVKLDSEHCEL